MNQVPAILNKKFDFHNLEVCDLGYSRGEQEIFRHVNFTLHSSEVLILEGANGSGKTTLLKCLAGLLSPAEGVVYWQGRECLGQGDSEFATQRCFVTHTNGIKAALTPYENAKFGMVLPHLVTEDWIQWALEAVQLTTHQNKLCQSLSQGQNRRVGLMRLLLANVPIWLLDEPLASLDIAMQVLLAALIRHHLDRQGMVLMSSHQAMHLPGVSMQVYRL